MKKINIIFLSRFLTLTGLIIFSFLLRANTTKNASKIQSENETIPLNESQEEEEINISKVIFDHVLDQHEFHFFSIKDKHYSLPLPIIVYSKPYGLEIFSSSHFHHNHGIYSHYKLEGRTIYLTDENHEKITDASVYDFSITKNTAQLLLSTIILLWMMLSISKSYKKRGYFSAPKGLQSLLEPIIIFVRDEIAIPNLGKKHEKYLPYLLSLFFFILINNLFGLLPGSANVSGSISFTLLLGVFTFILMLFSSNSHFWGHIFNPPVPFLIKFIMAPIEFMGIFTKPFALIIRLFANMLAGHIVIICIISLIFIFSGIQKFIGIGFAPVSIAFAIFMYLMEIIVAFLQAYIFAILTALFIGQTFESELNENHH